MGSPKCIMTFIHDYSIIYNSFIALELSCASSICPFPTTPPFLFLKIVILNRKTQPFSPPQDIPILLFYREIKTYRFNKFKLLLFLNFLNFKDIFQWCFIEVLMFPVNLCVCLKGTGRQTMTRGAVTGVPLFEWDSNPVPLWNLEYKLCPANSFFF